MSLLVALRVAFISSQLGLSRLLSDKAIQPNPLRHSNIQKSSSKISKLTHAIDNQCGSNANRPVWVLWTNQCSESVFCIAANWVCNTEMGNNWLGYWSAVLSGVSNNRSGYWSAVLSGMSNNRPGYWSAVLSGMSNNRPGYWSVVLYGVSKNTQGYCLLVACFTSEQHASASQEWICTDNFTCCHPEVEAADQTFYLTQSQYTDTRPTSPSVDPITPGAWQGPGYWSAVLSSVSKNRPGYWSAVLSGMSNYRLGCRSVVLSHLVWAITGWAIDQQYSLVWAITDWAIEE